MFESLLYRKFVMLYIQSCACMKNGEVRSKSADSAVPFYQEALALSAEKLQVICSHFKSVLHL